ncbi:MAG TPA: AAA family ATPase [Candidatus Paceibacterota bacterium]|nr:AAA family ATPase [Candidatus Paceibacterota bacterium]
MYLKSLELSGFKSFAKKSTLEFNTPITAIVGPNGSGKSNVAESFRFVLGEQSFKSMRGKKGEDLIFNGGKDSPRANRASVKVIFDNTDHALNVDFDEVSIERVVHRDGINQYLINGSEVRLRDIIELLAGAHIGASGHHIISQGEADKILNANLRERRAMIEDALGLKIYQYKKEESERKLEKTEENIKQVESLRREIAPHLKFLKKQVEKLEKAREMKVELGELYKEYFKREEMYLSAAKAAMSEQRRGPQAELAALEKELQNAKGILERTKEKDSRGQEIINVEGRLKITRSEKDVLTREAGRIEGEIAYLERTIKKQKESKNQAEQKTVYLREVESLKSQVESLIKEAEGSSEVGAIKSLLSKIRNLFSSFVESNRTKREEANVADLETELSGLNKEKVQITEKLQKQTAEENKLNQEYLRLKEEVEKGKDSSMEAERKMLQIMARQTELHAALNALKSTEERLNLEEADFKRELGEAGALLGKEASNYQNFNLPEKLENRNDQLERRRYIEKIKIRLEEAGAGGGEDIMKEYKEAEERDAFLGRELEDLDKSAASLKELIADLENRLDIEFKEGVRKINEQFNKFFGLMFGHGGRASLEVVREKVRARRRPTDEDLEDMDLADMPPEDDEAEAPEGIDISVSLPHKKIKGLVMLSGGERALTSIALLFAISQVNPPPFIILDETDAALDEANSRKYGDMIENLSKYSQLILITHNRETMSRAGIIYGVTMGGDGLSKLLSIQFEEAVAVAK